MVVCWLAVRTKSSMVAVGSLSLTSLSDTCSRCEERKVFRLVAIWLGHGHCAIAGHSNGGTGAGMECFQA
jgi:hypothetical protein